MKRATLLSLVPATAAVAALLRWAAQGSANLYTNPSKQLYVPDADLGWRLTDGGPLWLGLDAVAGVAAVAVGLFGLLWLAGRRGWRLGPPALTALTAIAVLPWLVPVYALSSGGRPDGALDRLPGVATTAPTGIAGRLVGLPAGTYEVLDHEGTSLVAELSAGGEAFEARFASDIEGLWRGDPEHLRQPMTATFTVRANAVDTGIDLRSKHAREYLQADEFPVIRLELTRVTGATQLSPEELRFGADARLELMGRTLELPVTGSLRALDAPARQRLGITADAAILLQARLELDLRETALAGDVGDFDTPSVPIVAQLVLARAGAVPVSASAELVVE